MKLCPNELTVNLASETPNAISISGMDMPPMIYVVLASQAGGYTSANRKPRAAITTYKWGALIVSLRDNFPETNETPNKKFADADTTKMLIPKAKPSSPKAKRQSGNPIFPLLAKTVAGRNAPMSRLINLKSIAEATILAPTARENTPAAAPKSEISTSKRVSVENIRQGTAKFTTKPPIILVSNGIPDLPQANPIPAITKSGAMIVAISNKTDKSSALGQLIPQCYQIVWVRVTPVAAIC